MRCGDLLVFGALDVFEFVQVCLFVSVVIFGFIFEGGSTRIFIFRGV